MAAGFQVFKETGEVLFDSDYVTHGLVKSGYLTFVTWYGVWQLRSANLPGNSEGDYRYGDLRDPICGITVENTIEPIIFLAGGVGQPVAIIGGQGATRTFLFKGVEPNTRAYVFDRMRDMGTRAGMQAFNAQGALTFTSEMPALNIMAAIAPPAIHPGYPSNANVYPVAYTGGSDMQRPYNWGNINTQRTEFYSYIDVNSGIGSDIGVHLTFSRQGGTYQHSVINGCSEGAGGIGANVRFYFAPAVATTEVIRPGPGPWFDIPKDRAPIALCIRLSDYPFPFN